MLENELLSGSKCTWFVVAIFRKWLNYNRLLRNFPCQFSIIFIFFCFMSCSRLPAKCVRVWPTWLIQLVNVMTIYDTNLILELTILEGLTEFNHLLFRKSQSWVLLVPAQNRRLIRHFFVAFICRWFVCSRWIIRLCLGIILWFYWFVFLITNSWCWTRQWRPFNFFLYDWLVH